MASVFRIATEQAIKEIIESNSQTGRFGWMVTEENMEEISKRVVDLFEMTLELRAKTQDIFGAALSQTTTQTAKNEAPFPKTRSASEIYSYGEGSSSNAAPQSSLTPNMDLKLPRKRYEMSLNEREQFMKR